MPNRTAPLDLQQFQAQKQQVEHDIHQLQAHLRLEDDSEADEGDPALSMPSPKRNGGTMAGVRRVANRLTPNG